MKLLILGGTRFLGRGLVDAALARGHDVTLFNRGQSNPDLYPELETLVGDRDGDLEALNGRAWDAVIDTCGYAPRIVRASAELLSDSVGHYTFISSISVYTDVSQPGVDENAPVGTLEDESVEEITAETYGPLKALCEQAATDAMDGRALHVRAGLIVGPHDTTDRFSYWPYRVAQGGEVLAPGRPDYPSQFIDVRDLAAWIIRATEAQLTGPNNVTSPAGMWTLGVVLGTCREVTESNATFTWIPDEFLLDHDVEPFMELPLWLPEENKDFNLVDVGKAVAAGLTIRPLSETVRATYDWLQTRSGDREWRSGLLPAKEVTLLQQWHAENGIHGTDHKQ